MDTNRMSIASGKNFCIGRLDPTRAHCIRTCHAPNPVPTRLADPNRFSGREAQDWDSLPDFFDFFYF